MRNGDHSNAAEWQRSSSLVMTHHKSAAAHSYLIRIDEGDMRQAITACRLPHVPLVG